MTAAKRIMSVCAVLLLSAVLVCCAILIVFEAEHDCIGDRCPICAQAETFDRLLKTISKACEVAFTAAAVCFFAIVIAFAGVLKCFDTLISLKIKLTD